MTNGHDFLSKTLLQAEINRMKHGDEEADNNRPPLDWALIAGEHMGHLMGALRNNDYATIEQEILHISGPLLELHESLLRLKNKE
ncbi:MAG: hypothetical protein FH758_09645 [Firmicutes bacterium]|nr:hypothetical protein [Bacillota bacterium]